MTRHFKSLIRAWWYTAALLLTYISVFWLWRAYPSRAMFLISGAAVVALASYGLLAAKRRGYFANRSDLVLHALVIVDLAIESTIYEPFLAASRCLLCAEADVAAFHGGLGFCSCAAIFGLLVGGYHAWAHYSRPHVRAAGRPGSSPLLPGDLPVTDSVA